MMSQVLYKRAAAGLLYWWKIERTGKHYCVSWGVGNSNTATDNYNDYTCLTEERAEFEVASRINKQIDRLGYSIEVPTARPTLPMLAQKYSEHERLVKDGKREPFARTSIQPKLDGIRMLATRETQTSRRAEPIVSVPHIAQCLEALPPEIMLDGELFVPNTDFQTVLSLVKRQVPHKLYREVQYHVFDVLDDEMPFIDRYELLKRTVETLQEVHRDLIASMADIPEKLRTNKLVPVCPIHIVPTLHLDMPSNSYQTQHLIKQEFNRYRKLNFEGLIIRNMDGLYDVNTRSPDLLKFKHFEDHEFEIIDINEGYNKTGIFVCKTSEGKIFEATPAWTTPAKQVLLKRREHYIGRWVQVEYETLSREGVPLKPVGKLTTEKKDDSK